MLEVFGLILILVSLLWMRETDLWPGWLTLIPVSGAMLVMLAARGEAPTLTNHSLVQWLGTISYSVYLWHWPVVVGLTFTNLLSKPQWIVGGVALSLLLGHLSYQFVENPTRNFGRHKAKSGIGRGYLREFVDIMGIAAVAAGVGGVIFLLNGLPSRVPELVRVADAENDNNAVPTCNPDHFRLTKDCVLGEHPENIQAILIGDSHASALATALVEAVRKKTNDSTASILLHYRLGCVTIPGVKIRAYFISHCGEESTEITQKLSKEYLGVPIIIINRISMYMYGSPEFGEDHQPVAYFDEPLKKTNQAYIDEFRTKYLKSICTLAQQHPLYIMQPIPEFTVEVPQEIARQLMYSPSGKAKGIYVDLAAYNKRNATALEILNEAQQKCGIHLLDPTPYFCPGEQCVASINNRPIYEDSNHLSEYGNKFLVPLFMTAF